MKSDVLDQEVWWQTSFQAQGRYWILHLVVDLLPPQWCCTGLRCPGPGRNESASQQRKRNALSIPVTHYILLIPAASLTWLILWLYFSLASRKLHSKNIVSIGNLLLFEQYWVWGVYYSRIYDIQFFKNHLLYIIHWKHARTHNQRKKKLTPRWHFITRGDIILPHINFSCLRLGMMADLQFNLRSSHWLCNSQSRKHLSPLCYCIDTTEEAHINFNWMLAGISSYHCIKDVAKYSGLNCKESNNVSMK